MFSSYPPTCLLTHALTDTYLIAANLGYANLGYANLGYANLGYANLREAKLREAKLGGAKLGGAKLGGARLLGTNLIQAQLEATIGDENTQLPSHLKPPANWGVKTDEQIEES